jgi:MerR family transcriptional activator of bmr gene
LDTLRYYNEIQLFNPDYINPSNNYRFYSEDQVKELLYIIDLKECGFNLDEIKVIIKLNDKTKMKLIFEKKETELLNQSKKINLSLEKIKTQFKIMEKIEEKDMK